MKMVKQKKSGISLIVLVITIIVMIILAAAIILSLDGSNIIERAKEGQSSNDVATAKEVVALAKSEWSFERQEGYDTFREYAESKLEEAGFDMDNTYVEDSGRVLFDTAARFAKAGVEIGTEVTGYTLNSTASYTTSGKENTCNGADGETNPQPVTLTRDTNVKWTYIGVDEDGKAMLAGSVTSTTPKVTLGGKGGYLNGPAELDKICDAMYSSAKGTARSMKIDDVTRVLEYTGEKGSYYEKEVGNYIATNKPLTILEIAKLLNYDIDSLDDAKVDENKEIVIYKSNFYIINKTRDINEYNIEMQNKIYPLTTNSVLTAAYWLSSQSVYGDFSCNVISFNIGYVDSAEVRGESLFDSGNVSFLAENAIRPVVALTSDVQILYNGTTVTLQ